MSDSDEYKAFKHCHSNLLTCIKQSPKDVSDCLFPIGILASNDRDYVKNYTHDDSDKARRILDAVLLQIENDPRVFQSFISALNATGKFTSATVQKLNDALQRQNQQCDQTPKIEESGAEGDSNLGNISEAQLDREIGQCDMPHLAGLFDDVELYLDCCGLTPGEQTTVNEKKHSSGNHVAMIKCLTIWRTTNPKAATFRALLDFVVCLRKGETARQIRQYLQGRIQGYGIGGPFPPHFS